NTIDIKELKDSNKAQNNAPQLNTVKINALSKEVADHKGHTKQLSLDLKEFKKQYDEDKILIIKLLFEIKEQNK
ncbi:unnamed protein product, partial [marine sediment metagenome]